MEMSQKFEKMFAEHVIAEKFLKNREIFLWGGVDDKSSEEIVKKIMFLDSEGHGEIKLYVNSPGGVISSGLAIYDAMQSVKSEVSTICMGQAASMGAVLLAAGRKGKRYAWPHARIMIHQPAISGHMFGPASDIKIQADEVLRIREELNRILADCTGKPYEKIAEDTDRDFYMNAQQAIEYGVIDKIWE